MTLQQLVLTAEPDEFWFACIALGLAALAGAYFAVRSLRRVRMMEDTPTARIRSAAQGYGEFEGSARLMPGEPIRSPLTHRDCVWYRYKVEERHTDHHDNRTRTRWQTLDSGVSDSLFLIVDDTGEAIIDPDHAEFNVVHKRVWYGSHRFPGPEPDGFWSRFIAIGRYRYTEERIHEHDPLYVMGLFTSMTAAEQSSFHEDVGALLRSWKANPDQLLHRFDANQDGRIDNEEWADARQLARQQITRERQSIHANTHLHVICKPPHGHQTYLISSRSQAELIQRWRIQALLALSLFFAGGGFAVWMLNLRLH